MQNVTEKGNNRDQATAPVTRFKCHQKRGKFHYAFNFLIIISIVLCGTNTLSGETPMIRGVQIKLGDNNRICMSFEGEIRSIIVNGNVNLPGETFENITKVGDTKISRSHSSKLTRIGHIGIHRDWHGNIIKIGNADVLRNKHGSVIAVTGDPNVSPLFGIDSP